MASDATAALAALEAGPRPDVVISSAAQLAALVPLLRGSAPPVALLAAGGEGVPAAALRHPLLVSLRADPGGGPAPGEVERLEAAVRDAADAAAARRLASACRGSSAGLVLVGEDGRVERANEAFARLAGADAGALPGRLLAEILTADGGPEEAESLAAALRGGAPWNGEASVRRADGGLVPCRTSVASAGPGEGAVATFLDLTRRAEREASLVAANRRLEERSRLDPLCGLFNRACLHEVLDREMARARRYGHPFAVLMIDLDDFKRVNDAWGHDAGDETLRAVAVALKAGFREGDVVARYGGDEFCALLPSTDDEAASVVADRVRERVAALRLGPQGSVGVRASVGLATVADVDGHASGTAILRLADRAMLAAKRAGGNRVVAHRSMPAGAGTLPGEASSRRGPYASDVPAPAPRADEPAQGGPIASA